MRSQTPHPQRERFAGLEQRRGAGRYREWTTCQALTLKQFTRNSSVKYSGLSNWWSASCPGTTNTDTQPQKRSEQTWLPAAESAPTGTQQASGAPNMVEVRVALGRTSTRRCSPLRWLRARCWGRPPWCLEFGACCRWRICVTVMYKATLPSTTRFVWLSWMSTPFMSSKTWRCTTTRVVRRVNQCLNRFGIYDFLPPFHLKKNAPFKKCRWLWHPPPLGHHYHHVAASRDVTLAQRPVYCVIVNSTFFGFHNNYVPLGKSCESR